MAHGCKGLCERMEMPKPEKQGGFYRNGYKRCSPCTWFVSIKKLKELGLNEFRCPCCKHLLKAKPNHKEFRSKILA